MWSSKSKHNQKARNTSRLSRERVNKWTIHYALAEKKQGVILFLV